jgi:hypothetical protein
MSLNKENEVLKKALHDLSKYFKSGNDIPVDRAVIKAKDFWEIVKDIPEITSESSFKKENNHVPTND